MGGANTVLSGMPAGQETPIRQAASIMHQNLWTARATNHLQHVQLAVLHIAVVRVLLRALDYDQVGRQVDLDATSCRAPVLTPV